MLKCFAIIIRTPKVSGRNNFAPQRVALNPSTIYAAKRPFTSCAGMPLTRDMMDKYKRMAVARSARVVTTLCFFSPLSMVKSKVYGLNGVIHV